MKGKGVGAALEAMARLALPLSPRLGLDIEAGYALRIGSRFSGPGSYEYHYRDANAARDPVRYAWEDGEWRTRRLEVRRLWGDLAYTLSGNDLAGYRGQRKIPPRPLGLAAGGRPVAGFVAGTGRRRRRDGAVEVWRMCITMRAWERTICKRITAGALA